MRKLWSLGLQASLEEVVTVGAAIQHVLAERGHGAGAYVIGSPAIFRHVADAGQRIVNGTDRASEADVVVVAGHDDFAFRRAARRDPGGARGRRDDRAGPRPDVPHGGRARGPAPGAIVAALEYATERTATLVGKPEPQIFYTALDRLGRRAHAGRRRPARRRPGRRRGRGPRRRDRADGRQHPAAEAEARRGSRARRDRRDLHAAGSLDRRDAVADRQSLAPAAAAPDAALDGVRAALASHGLEHHVERTQQPRARPRAGAQRPLRAVSVAVAFGGDGLVGAVAGALKHSDGVLGVLPGGRGNDFARVLGIPLEPVAACAVLATGIVRELDLGEAGGRTFIGIASCGFDSEANRIANETRLVRGNLVYAYGALRALASWRPAHVHRHARRRARRAP